MSEWVGGWAADTAKGQLVLVVSECEGSVRESKL